MDRSKRADAENIRTIQGHEHDNGVLRARRKRVRQIPGRAGGNPAGEKHDMVPFLLGSALWDRGKMVSPRSETGKGWPEQTIDTMC